MAFLVLSILALDIVANIVLVQEIREALSYIKSKCDNKYENGRDQLNDKFRETRSRTDKMSSRTGSRGRQNPCRYASANSYVNKHHC